MNGWASKSNCLLVNLSFPPWAEGEAGKKERGRGGKEREEWEGERDEKDGERAYWMDGASLHCVSLGPVCCCSDCAGPVDSLSELPFLSVLGSSEQHEGRVPLAFPSGSAEQTKKQCPSEEPSIIAYRRCPFSLLLHARR